MKVWGFIAWMAVISPTAAQSSQPSPESRVRYAQSVDQSFLKKGMNASVAAMGEQKDIFYLDYVLVNRAFVYNFVNGTSFIKDLNKAGFVQARFTNGYGDNYCLNIKAKKFVDCY